MSGKRIPVYTDHAGLEHVLNQPHVSVRQGRWLTTLSDFDLIVHYKPGKENGAANISSRRPFPENAPYLLSPGANASEPAQRAVERYTIHVLGAMERAQLCALVRIHLQLLYILCWWTQNCHPPSLDSV